jgi:hypothetical protein
MMLDLIPVYKKRGENISIFASGPYDPQTCLRQPASWLRRN